FGEPCFARQSRPEKKEVGKLAGNSATSACRWTERAPLRATLARRNAHARGRPAAYVSWRSRLAHALTLLGSFKALACSRSTPTPSPFPTAPRASSLQFQCARSAYWNCSPFVTSDVPRTHRHDAVITASAAARAEKPEASID